MSEKPQDLATAGRELRAFADANIITKSNTAEEMKKHGRSAWVELNGRHYTVTLTRMHLDEEAGISGSGLI